MINNKRIKHFAVLFAFIFVSACGGGSDDGDGPSTQDPEAATLVFPIQNSECNEGTVISDTESNVTFEWNASAHTDKYTIVLKNLLDQSTRNINSNNTSKQETLLRGVPYSWYIISKSNTTTSTATSVTWKFYNAGEAVENYAPFPAGLVSPPMGGLTNTSLNLKWTGSDIDNDISSYDVYLSTSNPPETLLESTSNTTVNVSGLTANTVYYWRVVTNDYHGNNSQSPVFEFRTE